MFKMTKIKFAAVALTIMAIFAAQVELANAEEGVQLRGSSSVKWKFDDHYSLDLLQEYYATENFERFEKFKNAAGLSYYPADWLRLGADYVIGFENEEDQWKLHHGPRFSGKLKFEESDFKFFNRLMVEYAPDRIEPWRLRDKIKIKYTGFEPVQPFLADEVFVSLTGNGFLKNRAYVGFTVPVLKGVELDTFYILETVAEEEVGHAHVLGIKVGYRFR